MTDQAIGGIMDENELAKDIVDSATQDNEISLAAAIMGRRGGKIGGPARAKALTPEERTAIARKAAKARWKKESS